MLRDEIVENKTLLLEEILTKQNRRNIDLKQQISGLSMELAAESLLSNEVSNLP